MIREHCLNQKTAQYVHLRCRFLRFRGALVAAACVCFSASALAASVTLTADRDNTLFEDANGALSNGSGAFTFAGTDAGGVTRRTLLHFSTSGLPADAIITGVKLRLVVSQTLPTTVIFEVHRLLADWGEGSSNSGGDISSGGGRGAPSTVGDATWLHRFYPSLAWQSAGGEFAPLVSASQSLGGKGVYLWSGPELNSDVKEWLRDPSTNFGWLIQGGEAATQTARRFNSRENADPATRPQLIIDYTPPASVPLGSGWAKLALFVVLAGLGTAAVWVLGSGAARLNC
jgi:hypothetical protein